MSKYILGAAAAFALLAGTAAYAQTTTGLTGTVTSAPTTTNTTGSAPATLGVANGLGLILDTSSSVPAGTTGDALALIALDASQSQQAVIVRSIPIRMVFTGISSSDLSNCALRNISDLNTPLNTGGNALGTLSSSSSAITFGLDTPLIIPAGSSAVLALTCDVSAAAQTGGTVSISINPATVSATDQASGTAVTPAADIMSGTGQPAPTFGEVAIASASGISISSTGTSTTPPLVPGIPNTGAGGEAPLNAALLLMSGALVVLGGANVAFRLRKTA